ncbi:MAG: hypothetical protein GXY44_13540 [Phycisphaerales bacterium]|nr:hypothetical protein [Phycisphaerales bacterium]
MKSSRILRKLWRLLLVVVLGGTLNATNCGGWRAIAQNFNPMGTLLNGNPYEYDWLFIDHYPDWSIDPTCTIPGACINMAADEGD